MRALARLFVNAALLAVPPMWRDDVRRDLEEESASVFWRVRQAGAIGMRMRWTSRRRHPLTWAAPLHDLRFAFRTLTRQPGWTITAMLTLALGIGANAAVFGVVNATLLNPLPYPHADRVVLPWLATKGMSLSTPAAIAEAWRANARSLDAIERYRQRDAVWTGAGDPTLLRAVEISDTFASFAGMRFIVGRGFSADEASALAPVAVLSEAAWRARFGADRSVLGRSITIDGTPRTIVGVAADPVRFPSTYQTRTQRDVFLPIRSGSAEIEGSVMARLASGVTVKAAEQELGAIVAERQLMPKIGGLTFSVRLGRPADVVGSRDALTMISWTVALVLLIACVNVAHLLLARGLTRERELAIRTAIGARRSHIVRQLVTECVVLTAMSAVIGLALGAWMLRAITSLRPASLDAVTTATMSGTVVGATIGAAIAIGVALGALSAWRAGLGSTSTTLRATSTSSTENPSQRRVRSLLVIAEVAVAVVLLVGSAMLMRSVANLQKIDLGFNARTLYSLPVPLPPERCAPRKAGAAAPETVAFCRSIAQDWLDRIRVVPGVEGATLASTAPPHTTGFSFGTWERRDLGPSHIGSSGSAVTATAAVRSDYFRVMGLALTDGAGFDEGSAARHEVVLNKPLAAALWPGERAVGKQLRAMSGPGDAPGDNPWLTVVGVTADAAVQSILRDDENFTMYTASEAGGYSLIFRAAPGIDVTAAVRGVSLSVNPNLALPIVTNVARAFDEADVAAQRFTMLLLSVFAGLAVLLCAVGLYGVIAHLVSQRTREIGIRLALGGTPAHIGRLVLGRALALTMIGLVAGIAGSRWAVAVIAHSLYGVSPFDPAACVIGGAVLFAAAVPACIVPILRAIRVDPLTAVRTE